MRGGESSSSLRKSKSSSSLPHMRGGGSAILKRGRHCNLSFPHMRGGGLLLHFYP